jgi:hypothetical protein
VLNNGTVAQAPPQELSCVVGSEYCRYRSVGQAQTDSEASSTKAHSEVWVAPNQVAQGGTMAIDYCVWHGQNVEWGHAHQCPADFVRSAGLRLGAYRVYGNGNGTQTVMFNLWRGLERIGAVWYRTA